MQRVSILFAACCLLFLLSACDVQTGADSCINPSDCNQPSNQQSGTNYQSMAYQDAINAGIPADKFVKQIQVESGFDPSALSPMGAIGIAQIMPSTANAWNVNPHDPIASLQVASQHMYWYYSHYGFEYSKALACYNAGCGTLENAMHNCSYFYWCLPYQTRHYIDMIMN